MTLTPEPTALEPFLAMHLGQFESLAAQRQIHYAYDLLIDPALVVALDREKSRQILYNLLSNAIKFTPAHGSVRLSAQVKAGQLFIDVADTGPGIHPADVPHVFDRFFQTSRTGPMLAGGTGIGLSICQEYAHLMQGNIRVESQPGVGSLFRVSWPVAVVGEVNSPVAPLHTRNSTELYGMAGSAGAVCSSKACADATRPLILVVEDNPDLRAYISMILGEQYTVVTTENGQEALQWIAASKTLPDLILSDLMMPVVDGYTLLEILKTTDATRHLPVIMLTARAEAADRLQALRIGVDDYLTKPFDEEELLVRIANLLRNQTVRRKESLAQPQESEPATSPVLS